MKKILVTMMLFALLPPMSSCGDDDLFDSIGLTDQLIKCPTDGIYEGRIDKIDSSGGVWCEITSYPKDAAEKGAPSNLGLPIEIYFDKKCFSGVQLQPNMIIKFIIIKFGPAPSNTGGIFICDRVYISCIVKPYNSF